MLYIFKLTIYFIINMTAGLMRAWAIYGIIRMGAVICLKEPYILLLKLEVV
jgi:hypothetical protein